MGKFNYFSRCLFSVVGVLFHPRSPHLEQVMSATAHQHHQPGQEEEEEKRDDKERVTEGGFALK